MRCSRVGGGGREAQMGVRPLSRLPIADTACVPAPPPRAAAGPCPAAFVLFMTCLPSILSASSPAGLTVHKWPVAGRAQRRVSENPDFHEEPFITMSVHPECVFIHHAPWRAVSHSRLGFQISFFFMRAVALLTCWFKLVWLRPFPASRPCGPGDGMVTDRDSAGWLSVLEAPDYPSPPWGVGASPAPSRSVSSCTSAIPTEHQRHVFLRKEPALS